MSSKRKNEFIGGWFILKLWIIAPLILLVICAPSLAQNSFTTQRAVVFYQSEDDLDAMDRGLRFTPLESFSQAYFTAWPAAQNPSAPRLAAKIDGLLNKVCEILQLWPSEDAPLRICFLKDDRELLRYQLAYQNIKRRPLFGYSPLEAFYQPLTQTIYLSGASLRTGILAHEMVHFVLCTALPTPPPPNIQDDLASFVETQLE